MLEQLFKFPIALVDEDNEQRKSQDKQRFGDIPNTNSEAGYDIVIGEAEYPYWDLIGVEDRWLPTRESFLRAQEGRFDACIVKFANVGTLLVAWSKKRFRNEWLKFAADYEAAHPPRTQPVFKVKTLTEEEAKKLLKDDTSK